MNKLIFDGRGLLRGLPHLRRLLVLGLERAREELLRCVETYVTGRGEQAIVVLDGRAATGEDMAYRNTSIQVRVSPHPFLLMKEIISALCRESRLTVVTDDPRLVDFANTHRVAVWSSHTFLAHLRKRQTDRELDNKFDGELSQKELDDWMQLFGLK